MQECISSIFSYIKKKTEKFFLRLDAFIVLLLLYDSYASVELSSFSWRFRTWRSLDLYDICGTASLVDWRKWEREDYPNKDLLFSFFHFLDSYLY